MAITKLVSDSLGAGVGGKILQVVYSLNSYQNTTSSTSAVDVLSASGVTWEPTITPSSTSSKIIISADLNGKTAASGIADTRARFNVLYKIGAGSYTSLAGDHLYSMYSYDGNGVSFSFKQPFQYLITPSTTSAITVKFTYNSINASCTTEVNPNGTAANSTCILYEVAG